MSSSFVGLSIILFQESHAYLSIRQCTDFISFLTEMPQTKTLFFLCLVQPCAVGSSSLETCFVERRHLEASVSTAFIVNVYVLRPLASLILSCFIKTCIKESAAKSPWQTCELPPWGVLQSTLKRAAEGIFWALTQSTHGLRYWAWNTDMLASGWSGHVLYPRSVKLPNLRHIIVTYCTHTHYIAK